MRRLGKAYTIDEIKALNLKGALYIRMSTDLQVESPENQNRQMLAYAETYGIEIVKIYVDRGVSGLTADKREQFQALIDDVERGRNDFGIVLYLDETRWGRFVDSREADYYRMRLERKNVICQTCDKPLTLTNNIADRIMTILKDESASDYSRQLSQKVFIGQCNLIHKGYRQGGHAGFGLRRMLLDESGNHKQELNIGQRKSLLTERVILIPGPPSEVAKVLWIYDQFITGFSESEIATRLNSEGWKTDLGRLWTRSTVHEVLTNEKYIGNNLFNRSSAKLKTKLKPNPENEWIRKNGAFIPIIDSERFYKVQEIIKNRQRKISNDELLDYLQKLKEQKGRLSAMIIDEAEGIPPSSLYSRRFGGLLRAYQLIGYIPAHDYRYIEINRRLRLLHNDITNDTISRLESICGQPFIVDPETHLLEINHNLYISIVISRCFRTSSGRSRWKIRFDTGLSPDITVAVRMNLDNQEIYDYYILPFLEFGKENLKLYEENQGLLDSFRFDSLDQILRMSININLDEVA
jgi:DNA invertase Pin-like site-specific DNA recombinase